MNLAQLKKNLNIPPPTFQKRIGFLVFAERVGQGLTQKQLAERIGTHQSAIARIETGSLLPSLKTLKKVADALKVEIIVSFSNK